MSLRERVRVLREATLASDWGVLKKTWLSYRRRDGAWQEMARETYDRGDGAAILLYEPAARTVILTRQFRWPVFARGHDDLLVEVPAGRLDDASPAERIRAEAEEETGFRVREPREAFAIFMSPGSVTERLHLFVAPYEARDRVAEGGGERGEGEDIEVLEIPFEEAMAMVADAGIRDAKTIILLQHAALTIFGARATLPPDAEEAS